MLAGTSVLSFTHIFPGRSRMALVPEGRLSLARDFSPWRALEKGCVPSGRLKINRPSGTKAVSPLAPAPARSQRAAFQPEVRLGVIEADSADQTAQEFLVVREFTAFHVRPDQITKQAAEVFMTRIRHKTSRIG